MNRRSLSAVGLLAATCTLFGCGSSPENTSSTDESVEVFNWWTNPGESDALSALIDLFESKHPQTQVINAAVETLPKAQAELRTRMTGGAPPDTFQVIGGGNLLQWVLYNGTDDRDSKVERVDSIIEANGLLGVTPKPVLDAVSYEGHAYAVPLAVHRFNTLFYNKKLFDDNGLAPPTTLDEFYEVGDALKAKGIVPLALGSKDGFFASILIWDGVLIAKAGAEFRESYFSGTEDPRDRRINDTLEEVVRVLDYTNADSDSLNWDGAAQMVVDGTAAMTVMGDWAKGYFLSKGWKPGVELGQGSTPGTDGVFVYIVNSFTLPKGIAHEHATTNFLNLIAGNEAQSIFNPIKGAIPPRTDADVSAYDSLAQMAMSDFRTGQLTRARPVLVKNPVFTSDLDVAMRQFVIDRDVDTVVNVLTNRYDLLKSK